MTDGAIDRLKEMVNKPFLYQNEEVVILITVTVLVMMVPKLRYT